MPWNGSGATASGLAELMSISLLKPSRVEQERARPARRRAAAARVASNDSAISSPGRDDDEHVVDCAEQRAHVALARVAARQLLPRRRPRDTLA